MDSKPLGFPCAGIALALAFVVASGTCAGASPCLEAAFGGDANCTANDISVSSINVTSISDGCTGSNDTFTFSGNLNVQPPAQARYDIGFFIGAEPEASTSSDCFVGVIDPSTTSVDGDACGDTNGSALLQVAVADVTAPCADADLDGFLDVAVCSSWGDNAGTVCTGPADAKPQTSSKCHCEVVATDLVVPATEFVVNTTNDTPDAMPGDGICADIQQQCSLRAAIREANATFGNDRVTVPAGTYFVTSRLAVVSNIEIVGAGADKTILDGSNVTTILVTNAGTASARGLTLQNSFFDAVNGGTASGALTVNSGGNFELSDAIVRDSTGVGSGAGWAYGAGISNHDRLTLKRVVVTGNTASLGGGVFSGTNATTVIDTCRITDNSAIGNANVTNPCGGGVWVQNGATIRDTTIEGNTANRSGTGCGGGLYNAFNKGILSIERSLFVDNGAAQNGALQNTAPGVVEITNSTFSGNYSIGGAGAAIGNIVSDNSGQALLTFNNCTVAGHALGLARIVLTSGNGTFPATTRFKNTISDNPGKIQCEKTGNNVSVVSLDYNLMSDATCFASAGHDNLSATASLDALADYGGPTQTFRPGAGSEALNSIPPSACTTASGTAVTTDQRGAARPAGGACERGAFERAVCGDGISGGPEQCDDGNTSAGDCCSGACLYEAAGAACGSASDTICDDPDSCDGAGSCNSNFASSSTTCRGAAGSCDVAEKCTGTNRSCPANQFAPSTVVCRVSAGTCDVAETCSGASSACPANVFAEKGKSCGSSGESDCNHADTCNGAGACSTNVEPDGTLCDDHDTCSFDQCEDGLCESIAISGCPLLPIDQAVGDEFGADVALSPLFLVVGAPASQNSSSGRVHVFRSTDEGFIEQVQTTPIPVPLVDPDSPTGALDFGAAVAIDGSTIVAGAPFDQVAVGDKLSSGSASVFFFDGTSWLQQAKLVDTSGECTALATDVAIRGDTIVLGAPGGDCALVFERAGSGWTLSSKLASQSKNVRFGRSVDISADSILVGAPGAPAGEGCSGGGAVYAFRRIGPGWELEDSIPEPGDAGGGTCFGVAVALDGQTGVIGAPRDDTGAIDGGAAHVVERSGQGQWDITFELLAFPPRAAGANFGAAVDVRGDMILVGAPGVAAYLFRRGEETSSLAADDRLVTRIASKWDSLREYNPPEGSSPTLSKFGTSVALEDGEAVIGAPGEEPDGIEDAGAVYPADAIPVFLCGNGDLDDDEQCDDGDDDFTPGARCNGTCQLVACGDPNDSGSVTAGDALFALRASVGVGACDVEVCDVNQSGGVTATDALAILRKSVGLNVALNCP